MKENKLYYVVVTYPLGKYWNDCNFSIDTKIEKLCPKKHTGTGSCFANDMRDHSFNELSRKEADSIARRARKIKGAGRIGARIYRQS